MRNSDELFPIGCLTKLRATVPWIKIANAQVSVIDPGAEEENHPDCRRCLFLDEEDRRYAAHDWRYSSYLDEIGSVFIHVDYLDPDFVIMPIELDMSAIDEMFDFSGGESHAEE